MKMTATVALLGTLIASVTSRAQQTPLAGSQATGPVPIATRVDSIIARQMQMRRIPGLSLGVVKNGTLLLAKGYGDATVEWNAPATPDTVYLLASMTKPFTAIAIMMLAGAGRLSIDEPISMYVAGGAAERSTFGTPGGTPKWGESRSPKRSRSLRRGRALMAPPT